MSRNTDLDIYGNPKLQGRSTGARQSARSNQAAISDRPWTAAPSLAELLPTSPRGQPQGHAGPPIPAAGQRGQFSAQPPAPESGRGQIAVRPALTAAQARGQRPVTGGTLAAPRHGLNDVATATLSEGYAQSANLQSHPNRNVVSPHADTRGTPPSQLARGNLPTAVLGNTPRAHTIPARNTTHVVTAASERVPRPYTFRQETLTEDAHTSARTQTNSPASQLPMPSLDDLIRSEAALQQSTSRAISEDGVSEIPRTFGPEIASVAGSLGHTVHRQNMEQTQRPAPINQGQAGITAEMISQLANMGLQPYEQGGPGSATNATIARTQTEMATATQAQPQQPIALQPGIQYAAQLPTVQQVPFQLAPQPQQQQSQPNININLSMTVPQAAPAAAPPPPQPATQQHVNVVQSVGYGAPLSRWGPYGYYGPGPYYGRRRGYGPWDWF